MRGYSLKIFWVLLLMLFFNGYFGFFELIFLSLLFILVNWKNYRANKKLYVKHLKLYSVINILMLFIHPFLFTVLHALSGLSGEQDDILDLSIKGVIGSIPTLITMLIGILIAFLRKRDFRPHLFWGLLFSNIVIFGYVIFSYIFFL